MVFLPRRFKSCKHLCLCQSFTISFRAITETHSEDKNGVEGRILKSSLMRWKTWLICQILKSLFFFFKFSPLLTCHPTMELVPEDCREGTGATVKMHTSSWCVVSRAFPLPWLAEGEQAGRWKDSRVLFTCARRLGRKRRLSRSC